MKTMREIFCGVCCTLLLLVSGGPARAAEPPDEAPFRESAQAFLDAYVARDVTAIGDLFTENAEFFDEFGGRTEGRDAIVQMYADTFASNPDVTVNEIQLERLRQITDNVVMEEGVIVVTPSADATPYQSRYVALHTLEEDGKWRINSLKDFPPEPLSRLDQLTEMSWMLGDWVNEDGESVVHTSCNWTEDGNFLLKSFTVQTYDGREMSGEQRIGWDASRKRIRSWTFDSEGGHLNGLWTRDGNNWIVYVVGATADGRTVSGMAVHTVIDSEMIEWQYKNLVVGDEIRGASDPIRMVRRPPAPAES